MPLSSFAQGKIGFRHLNAFVDALNTALALLAPKAGPTFTGTVTIPTPAAADSSTKAASTAFVQSEKALATYTVGTLPDPTAAVNLRKFAHCSDGNAGADCVVFCNGTAWKVIALGATAAAS